MHLLQIAIRGVEFLRVGVPSITCGAYASMVRRGCGIMGRRRVQACWCWLSNVLGVKTMQHDRMCGAGDTLATQIRKARNAQGRTFLMYRETPKQTVNGAFTC